MPLIIAIVGRPNVGKSTLFNRLAGRKLAIVHDTPGVTRDRKEVDAQLAHIPLRIIDTAGYEEAAAGTLPARMTGQTLMAIADADVCLFMIDGREGVTVGDELIAAALRKSGKKVVLIANKCESRRGLDNLGEAFALGFGEAVAMSAEHGTGLVDLVEALKPFVPTEEEIDEDGADEDDFDDGPSHTLKLAIVGRPNVGKSSLFNRLLGEDRSLTGPEAGITRDAVAAAWKVEGRKVLLHDTAGLRRRARIEQKSLEHMSVGSSLTAIKFADCVIVVIDATAPFEKQELTIADLIVREGRAVVFAVNKWDLIEDRAGAVKRLREQLDQSLPQIVGAPLVGVSALTGEGLARLLPAVLSADAAWNTRVPTARLNRFLIEALERHPPPAVRGRRVRIRYMTQVKARPPSFALFGTQLEALPDSYLRYLQNLLRETFALKGVPIRFALRTTKNPYADKK